jgi:predicted alpha/beta-hydrolase family hydrolase
MTTAPRDVEVPGGRVRTAFDGPPDAPDLLILAHGAGAGMDLPFMAHFAAGLGRHGIRVMRFNFLYSEQGRKAPDRGPVLEETYRRIAGYAQTDLGPKRLFLGGKSMGGRIASQIAAGDVAFPAAGLVFLGYPLHPPGRPERLRDAHLATVSAPMLFVEGTRDPFCPLETLRRVLERVAAPSTVVVVEDGDHSFKVRKSSGRTAEEALDEAIASVASWITGLGE